MIINLEKITYFYLTNNNKIRKDHLIKEFKNCKLVEVNPVVNNEKCKSGVSGFSRILDYACKNQDCDKPFQPFVILEDDVKKYREFPEKIEIPRECDILYIGLSNSGLGGKPTLPLNTHVCFQNINDNIIRIYNMLSTHGMIICSMRGLLTFQKCLLEDYYKNRLEWDISICKIQPFLNVYALKEPLVYQYKKIGGNEIQTKINYKFLKDRPIPKSWIDLNTVSIMTMIREESIPKEILSTNKEPELKLKPFSVLIRKLEEKLIKKITSTL